MEHIKDYAISNSISMSDDVRALIAALIKAKKNFSKTGKSGSNTHLKTKYAKIDDIFNAVEPSLHDNDITIVHFRRTTGTPENRQEILLTRLVHALSGQWIEDECHIESEKPGNQGKGGALTYMRKAAVLSLCGLCPEDDDGESEQQYTREAAIEPEQASELNALLLSLPPEQRSKAQYNIFKFNKVNSITELKTSAYDRVKVYLLKEKGQK